MPVVGERVSAQSRGVNYSKNADYGFAKKMSDALNAIREEASVDIFKDPRLAYSDDDVKYSMRKFFTEGMVDENDISLYPTSDDVEDAYKMLNEQFENDCEAINEYAAMQAFNPVIAMSPMIHKNILIDTTFDKGVIPKFVAVSPKFTVNMETRIMRDAAGNEIDMWLQQNQIFDFMESTAPLKDTFLKLPETGTTNILQSTFGASETDDNLSIESSVTALLVKAYWPAGTTLVDENTGAETVASAAGEGYAWVTVAPKYFVPAYGGYDRQMMESFAVTVKTDAAGTTKVIKGDLMGNTKKNRFSIYCTNTEVVAVKLTSRIDTSTAMLRTCTVDWKVRTDIVEIPNAIPINTPISPEEVKDLSALYGVNQLTKLMSMFKLVLANYKDEKIHRFLDKSYLTIPEASKFNSTFDFIPRDGYFSDPIDWRRAMFMDQLETFIRPMLEVLNDPNMTVTIVGRSDLIRKITPDNDQVTYTSPDSLSSIQMSWKKTVVTSSKIIFQFMSTDKMRDNNNLIVLLTPRNSERIIYRLYDYQMYVSNEIRNAANWALPAIHAFERFKCMEYQPIQGRYRILNPTGLKHIEQNSDPIGVNRLMTRSANDSETDRANYYNEEAYQRVDHVASPNSFIY